MTREVSYRIGAAAPASHEYDVVLRVSGHASGPLRLAWPAWIPGSYMIRDYARHVTGLRAVDSAGDALPVSRDGKSGWIVQATAHPCEVQFTVYAWDLSVRGAHLDGNHAYFNGVAVFPEVVGHEGEVRLRIDPIARLPEDAWVATSLSPVQVDARGFGEYVAADYVELIDHPVEIAVQTEIGFPVCGIPHRFVVRGAQDFDTERLRADCERICASQHALLGTPADLDRYTFLAYAEADAYGGLEHRWSSSLAIRRGDLPLPHARHDAAGYRRLLGLISHEYFHLWNVRRLRPKAFAPLDLAREVHTRLLWVFEGVTSYYDDLSLVRAGVISTEDYLQMLAEQLTRVWRTPGRARQSLAESSHDAWTRFYRQDENAPNAIVSYYTKGAAVALALDLMLRSEGTSSLDEVIRACWQRFHLASDGMPEDGFETVASELAGRDLSDFFSRVVHGTEDPDLAALLATVGIEWTLRPAQGPEDRGGRSGDGLVPADAGLRLERGGARIAVVLAGGPASTAGLSAGDQLVAVDGLATGAREWHDLLLRKPAGTRLQIHVFRSDRLLAFELVLAEPVPDTVSLALAAKVDDSVRQRRAQWLAGPDDALH